MRTRVYNNQSQLRSLPTLFSEMKRDLKASYELGLRLAIRNLSAMYRRSVLGYLWAILPPLVSAGVFFLLKRGGVTSIELSVPYGAWLIAGTFLWQSFADAITGQLRSFTQSKQMLSKINFARESIVVAGVFEALFNFAIRFVILLVLLFLMGVTPGPQFVWVPLGLVLMLLFGTICGLILGPLALIFQDIERALPMILPLLMILSGVVIPFPREGFLGWFERFNPMSIGVNLTRESMLGMEMVSLVPGFVSMALLLAISFLGWILFRLTFPHVASRIPS